MTYFFFKGYGDHRYLHLLTHSFPTRRSSEFRALYVIASNWQLYSGRGSQKPENDRKSPLPACPFERSGDAHRAWLRPMGVSTSLDTNGKREWQQTTGSGHPIYRHPGLDPGSMTSAPPWIPDQVRDDDRLDRKSKRLNSSH